MVKWAVLGILLTIGGNGLAWIPHDRRCDMLKLDVSSHQVAASFAKKMAQEELYVCGIGGSEDKGKILNIKVVFQYGEILDISAARRLIVDLVLRFLDEINHDESVQKLLHHTPFTPQDVIIDIVPDHSQLTDEECKTGVWTGSSLGRVRYYIHPTLPLEKLLEETFEEAQQRLQEES